MKNKRINLLLILCFSLIFFITSFDCAYAAEENGIPCQTKTMVAGGNDAGAIHVSRGGVKTAAVSLPCRYLHSPSCVINKADFENAYVLTKLILDRTYNK